jgi:hypothetical protein
MPTTCLRTMRLTVTFALAMALFGCDLDDQGGNQSMTSTGGTGSNMSMSSKSSPCNQAPNGSGGTNMSCPSGFQGVSVPTDVDIFNAVNAIIAYDPVILEVPAAAGNFSGTMNQNVPPFQLHYDLQVTAGLAAIPIDANTTLVAEPGTQLVIVDVPDGFVPGSYAVQFRYTNAGPSAKVIFAGKVQVNGTTYYPPLLPCVSDFADVASISTTSFTPADALALAHNLQGCNHKVYDYGGGGAPPEPVEVVEFYNAALDHYFITWVPNEIAILDAGVQIKGWVRTGKSFKTYSSAVPGASQVCRFYIPPPYGDSHFFGRGQQECDQTAQKFPQFVLEDAHFMYMFLPVNGVCPANTVEVHRAFSNRADANHRYFIDPAIGTQMQGLGWLLEGDGPDLVVMCAPQ